MAGGGVEGRGGAVRYGREGQGGRVRCGLGRNPRGGGGRLGVAGGGGCRHGRTAGAWMGGRFWWVGALRFRRGRRAGRASRGPVRPRRPGAGELTPRRPAVCVALVGGCAGAAWGADPAVSAGVLRCLPLFGRFLLCFLRGVRVGSAHSVCVAGDARRGHPPPAQRRRGHPALGREAAFGGTCDVSLRAVVGLDRVGGGGGEGACGRHGYAARLTGSLAFISPSPPPRPSPHPCPLPLPFRLFFFFLFCFLSPIPSLAPPPAGPSARTRPGVGAAGGGAAAARPDRHD